MYKKRKKIAKKTFGNFPFISVIFSVSLSLLLLGIFTFFVFSSFEVKKLIQENTEVNIYLNKEISSSQIDQVKTILFTKDYVLSKDESTLNYISSEEAAKEFAQEIGEDFVNLSISTNVAQKGNLLSSCILFLISIILINNTLKIALFSQRFLIRSMQLVGATASYILKPFLLRGLAYGFLSGVISSGILYVIILFINEKINASNMIVGIEKLSIIFIMLILTGILMVMLSTYTSVNKYLNSTLDDLYK